MKPEEKREGKGGRTDMFEASKESQHCRLHHIPPATKVCIWEPTLQEFIRKQKAPFKQSLKQVTFEKGIHSLHSYLIPRALLTATNQWWTKIPRVESQEMLISSFAFILKWPNAGAGHWTHNSTLEWNNIPNWLCSRGSLHKCSCRSVSGRRLCKKASMRASLEF